MSLNEKLLKAYMQIPDEEKEALTRTLNKYPLAFYLIDNFKVFNKFDTNQLMINDAHPKLIKDLVTNFYISSTHSKLTPKIVTKVLRTNFRSLRKIYKEIDFSRLQLINDFIIQVYPSFEIFIMGIFSDMPQIKLLTSISENITEIKSYVYCFTKLFNFLTGVIKGDPVEMIDKTKEVLRHSINYEKLKNSIRLAEEELKKVINNLTDINVEQEFLLSLQKETWSLNKFNSLHDRSVKTLESYNDAIYKSSSSPEKINHIELKIIEPLVIEGFSFNQLTTRPELRDEGNQMKHCVGSYYGANFEYNLFIFKVDNFNQQNSENDRSTLCIRVTKKAIAIQQNYSHHNETPTPKNIATVNKLIKILKDKYLKEFHTFIIRSDEIKNSKRKFNKPAINFDDYALIYFPIKALSFRPAA